MIQNKNKIDKQNINENKKQYEYFLKQKNGEQLVELEKKLQEIGNNIRNSNLKQPYKFNIKDLSTLMSWKLKRGVHRPSLEKLIQQNQDSLVQEQFGLVFKDLFGKKEISKEEVGKALDQICVLKGVGPATGSKVLSLINPYIPFMSDEALKCNGLQLQYNKSTYFKLYEKIFEQSKEQNYDITCEDLEIYFWVQIQQQKSNNLKKIKGQINNGNQHSQQKRKQKTQKQNYIVLDDEEESSNKQKLNQKNNDLKIQSKRKKLND
ncbi:hypothetical protein PPERSA_04144 [Pseudocohnilembus persalinus]|uniref:Uncharacterized protein n=1 Tax=Pseudocohnilembus persalinus TaxID=266149 RepID=A0A0V0QNF1_PSEPJ|nr:hypothetical protein PPERSA_04144 [Pseudocohnilembus persalinus]|eukprot:KRX03592.1 hypothetical protein PPERSA_04144 [Pseudocohnilembus persalinus]